MFKSLTELREKIQLRSNKRLSNCMKLVTKLHWIDPIIQSLATIPNSHISSPMTDHIIDGEWFFITINLKSGTIKSLMKTIATSFHSVHYKLTGNTATTSNKNEVDLTYNIRLTEEDDINTAAFYFTITWSAQCKKVITGHEDIKSAPDCDDLRAILKTHNISVPNSITKSKPIYEIIERVVVINGVDYTVIEFVCE